MREIPLFAWNGRLKCFFRSLYCRSRRTIPRIRMLPENKNAARCKRPGDVRCSSLDEVQAILLRGPARPKIPAPWPPRHLRIQTSPIVGCFASRISEPKTAGGRNRCWPSHPRPVEACNWGRSTGCIPGWWCTAHYPQRFAGNWRD